MTPRQRRKIHRGSRCVCSVSAGASGPSSHSAACSRDGMSLPADYSFRMQAKSCGQAEKGVPHCAIQQARSCDIAKPAETLNWRRRSDDESNFECDDMRIGADDLAEPGIG